MEHAFKVIQRLTEENEEAEAELANGCFMGLRIFKFQSDNIMEYLLNCLKLLRESRY